jgi:hypothetical protein
MAHKFDVPELKIVGHALLGLFLGLSTATVNRHINLAVHRKFKKDSLAVTSLSLSLQFVVLIGVLLLAANYLPFFDSEDLGTGVTAAVFSLFYFNSNVHFFSELEKLSEGKFNGVEGYDV